MRNDAPILKSLRKEAMKWLDAGNGDDVEEAFRVLAEEVREVKDDPSKTLEEEGVREI